MAQFIAPIFVSILKSLVTQAFVKEVLIHVAEYLAKQSDNDLDDKLVASLKKALHV